MRTKVRTVIRFLVVLLLAGLFAGVTQAQYSGNIEGVISDPSGAAIADASVELVSVDTGISLTTSTSASGNYRFSSLAPGSYKVRAQAKGFRTTEINVTAGTSELEAVNLTLPVAAVNQSVNVIAETAALDTDETRLQATLTSEAVADLPTVNRNLWDVLAVTPGVVGTGTRGPGESPGGGADNFGTQTPQLSANGRSYTGNVVFVDGMNVTSPIQNGNVILAPVPDAVQEASLQTNSWDAENNLGSSILIQITTKSGTSQFHGSGDLLFTNQDFQAHPDFSGVSPFSRKDLAGTLGGPIIKKKTFFFADFEKLWATQPEVQAGIGGSGVETWDSPQFDSWAAANFPNTIGTQILSQFPATYLKPNGNTVSAGNYYYGASGCPGGQTTIPITGTVTIPCSTPVLNEGSFVFSPYYNALQYNFRLDEYITPNDRLYFSYYNDSFDLQQPAPQPTLTALDIQRNRYGQLDYTHTFSPTLLLEGSVAFASVGGANGEDADLKVPDVTVVGQNVGYHVGGGWGPGEYRGPNYNWRAVLTWVRGAHTLKFGYDGDHAIEHGDFTPVNVRPSFTFNSLFDLVQDNVYQASVGAYNPTTGAPGTVVFGGQTNPFGFYAQDDWKVKSNLSLTLALRWDDYTNHTAWGNNGFQFNSLLLGSGSTLPQQITNASVGTVSGVFSPKYPQSNYWSPRIGFAWDPTKTGRWSIRGGIGEYRDWVVLGQSVDEMRNNPPGVISETFTTNDPFTTPGPTPLGQYFSLSTTGSYPWSFTLPPISAGTINSHGGLTGANGIVEPSNVWSLDRSLTAPLAVNYVIGVEHQLPWKLVAGANYSGSRSYDGLNGTDQNRYDGGAVVSGGTETIHRLNPYFTTINYVTNANASTYNAMVLSLRGSPNHRFSFQASYTYSRAMDYPEAGTRFDQDGGMNIPDPAAYFTYWGDANYDVRQHFSSMEVYTLPGMKSGFGKVLTSGWELTSIAVIQSGTPFWAYNTNGPTATAYPGDYNLDGVNWDVPNTPTTDFTGSHSRQAYKSGLFTAADFPAPTGGAEGNLKRNIYRNPGLIQVDASVLKNTHVPWLGEAGNFQLRFEFLNVFNHVNLGAVDANMADATFGKVTSALSARQLYLGAKISF